MNWKGKRKLFNILFIIFLCNFLLLNAQNSLLEKIIILEKTEVKISEVLYKMSEQGITFSYKDSIIVDDKLISLPQKEMKVEEILEIIIKDNNLTFKVYREHIIIKEKKKRNILQLMDLFIILNRANN